MNKYSINLQNLTNDIYPALPDMQGESPSGGRISFTNHYMVRDGKPFFGICGEFHFSRYDYHKWEDEIIKMKMSGINIIPTYIIWNHHEEVKGTFNWSGSLNIRHFLKLCRKHGIDVIMRIGPFDHGEVRNGGFPDWLYGEPCRVRSNDERYLFHVKRLYTEIGRQMKGLLYKDGGPVIGVQLENEYCHAGAPWEITAGTSNEWIPNGQYDTDADEHKKHIEILKAMAKEAGMEVPLYTGTGWGGAQASTDTVLPLWGGYAFWPWIFYDETVKEHPVTPEFIYRNYRRPTYNFEPSYDPKTVPFACCEMGGGMTCFYNYRFKLPFRSVEAMANIKTAGGCNFVGYYVYHGGSNPRGIKTPFLNENATPKISYDYQAPIGEYGQVRESYSRLKRLHYFFKSFKDSFCPTQTVLPAGAEEIAPTDVEQLRFAVRVDKNAGYIFINNYQDHLVSPDKKDFSIELALDDEVLTVPAKGGLSLASEESCILPFNLAVDGLTLKYASAQLITRLERDGIVSYFFFAPKGMDAEYCFDGRNIAEAAVSAGSVSREGGRIYIKPAGGELSKTIITGTDGSKVNIYTLTAEQSLKFWQFEQAGRQQAMLSSHPVLADESGLRIESDDSSIIVQVVDDTLDAGLLSRAEKIGSESSILTSYALKQQQKGIVFSTEEIAKGKVLVKIDSSNVRGLKEVLMQVDYQGDIGYAFVNNEMINDNFCNGAVWEIGLGSILQNSPDSDIYISVSPLKENQVIKSDSPMAARSEESGKEIVAINNISLKPVYEFLL